MRGRRTLRVKMTTTQPSNRLGVRRTLAREARVEGVTLFTGAPSAVTICPVKPGAEAPGIFFDCAKDGARARIPALHTHIHPESRRTVLVDPKTGASVQTVEHILSALAGLGITDATVRLEGPEIPVGDGSAQPFTEAMLAAGGAVEIDGDKSAAGAPLRITRRLEIVDPRDPTVRIVAEPLGAGERDALRVRYELDYAAARTGIDLRQAFEFEVAAGSDGAAYLREVAPARTFCTFAEAEAMRQAGMFKHLTPRDMLVLGPGAKPIENSLRFEDEPARHKVLDMIGDLALAGGGVRGIVGRVTATKTGHAHNHQMAKAIAEAFG